MKKMNALLIFKSISILFLMLNLGLTKLYSQDIMSHKKNNPPKNLNTQLFASVNYVNKSGAEDTYFLQKSYTDCAIHMECIFTLKREVFSHALVAVIL